jgi:exodeoxyribonuclease-5
MLASLLDVRPDDVKDFLRLMPTSSLDVSFRLNDDEDSDIARADLIIIDECSMVDKRLGLDLLSFGKPVLVLGDPF